MPHQFRHYEVITTLEQQQDSSTYLVNMQERTKQKAILKIFHKPALLSMEKREHFLQHVDKLLHLKHPHIVPILAGDIEKGSGYIVSEYMAGGSLRARLEQTFPDRLPFEEALTIVIHIGQALAYLHAQGIVHGHLMPKHIFFDAFGLELLSDIYISTEAAQSVRETSLNSVRYLAPEQCQENGPPLGTALSDQYALCCIAYELFSGHTPFITTDISELKEQQIQMQPIPLTSIIEDLPVAIDTALLRGLEKDPQQRYPTITALLSSFQMVLQTTTQVTLPAISPNLAMSGNAFIPPNASNRSDAAVLAHFTAHKLPALVTLTQSARHKLPALVTLTQSAKQSLVALQRPTIFIRQKKLWFGSALLTIICFLIGYFTFAVISPPVALTHGEAQKQTAVPPVASTKVVRTQTTATPIPTPTASTVFQPMPTSAATVKNNPTPTPTAATPKPTPTVSTANVALFTGQISAQAAQRGTYATNFISPLTVNNVRIEADLSNSGNGGGIAFRSNGGAAEGYRFFVETNGFYELLASSQVIARGYSGALHAGSNVTNHITIVAVGSAISIAINAQSIVNVSNNDYSSGGVGVMAVDLGRPTVTSCSFSIYRD